MLENIQNALLIYNLASGRRRHLRFAEIEEAARILNAADIRTELAPTTGRGTATGIARHAVAQNRDLVITCGGDGTINEVINGLAGSQVPMALLPAGTANILAKELGIPWNIPAAARLIPTSNLRRIALGSVMNATAARLRRPLARLPLFSLRSRRRPRWRHGSRHRSRAERSHRNNRLLG